MINCYDQQCLNATEQLHAAFWCLTWILCGCLCRPLLHALISPGIASGFGIEIDQIKCSKADAFLRQSAAALFSRGLAGKDLAVPEVQCSAIEKVRSFFVAGFAASLCWR